MAEYAVVRVTGITEGASTFSIAWACGYVRDPSNQTGSATGSATINVGDNACTINKKIRESVSGQVNVDDLESIVVL